MVRFERTKCKMRHDSSLWAGLELPLVRIAGGRGVGVGSKSDQMFSKYQVPIKSSIHFILTHSVAFAVISTPDGKSEALLLRSPELPVDLVFQVF